MATLLNIFRFCLMVIFVLGMVTPVIAQPFVPGNVYFDATGYVEYRAGNLPIIISAPHGGDLEPAAIPDRNCTGCVYTKDSWTKPITEGMYDAIFQETGCYPHVIINLLHRVKFDANRDIGDAADGNATVENAWMGYHNFIDAAKAQVTLDYGRGLFLDIHGHAHTIQRIELGYLLTASELRLTDAMLNTNTYIEESSIRTLVGDNMQSLNHSELLRGADALGTVMHTKGFPCVPSQQDPFPQVGDSYFSGGYNTVRHGSRDNAGTIDAIQIELNQDIRFDATTRAHLIDSLARAANQYIDKHYIDQYIDDYCSILLPIEWLGFEATMMDKTIMLQWSTLSELENSHFEIQRKIKDQPFIKIGEVKGNGTTNERKEYQFIDDHPILGDHYYRLKQVDFNGTMDYSPIVHVVNKNAQRDQLDCYPNPTPSGVVRVNYYSNKNKKTDITIFDLSGKQIETRIASFVEGENSFTIDLSEENEGVYLIKVGEEVRRIIKRK